MREALSDSEISMNSARGSWFRVAFACASTFAIVVPSVSHSELLCGTVTESIRLEEDCIGPMVIGASDIGINLNGFAVYGGIQLAPVVSNVKIHDGFITDTVTGVSAFASAHVVLERLSISGNEAGVFMLGGKHLTVINTVVDAGSNGIVLAGVDKSVIVGNEIRGGSVGLFATSSTGGAFVKNVIEGSTAAQDDSDSCANHWNNNDLIGPIDESDPGCIN